MQYSLLKTKLNIPPLRPNLVPRPRLIERLDQGLQQGSKLTLVSAPAGYGKSTLVTEWISELAEGREISRAGEETITQSASHRVADSQVAWLSLDATDNDIAHFISYLIASLQRIDQSIGAEIQPIVETDSDLPLESLVTALVNDIADWGAKCRPGQRCILVLDDYYHITEFSIHVALDFLIDHLPTCMQLVIMTKHSA